jgi:ABC-2 type transport system ATP-binding protein
MTTRHDALEYALRTTALRKTFRFKKETIEAVRGVDLAVRPGEIYGFLGPNGAGKTTTLRMLTTLLPVDSGEAIVAGADVRRHPREVRRRIGYVGQLGGTDLSATGRENLMLQGQLYALSAAETRKRAEELIRILELASCIERLARTFSWGQKRRLEIALGVLHRPDVLFLDEPTTGLDPQNRANLWDQLRRLQERGTTIFLTTHYLEEADQLSDRLAIIDRGRIVAEGTPQELKQRLAGSAVSFTPKVSPTDLQDMYHELAHQPFVRESRLEGAAIRLYVTDPTLALAALFERLRAQSVELEALSLTEPSLDDVFLHETGRLLRDAGEPIAKEAA